MAQQLGNPIGTQTTVLANGTDLNSIKKNGVYTFTQGTGIVNSPIDDYCILEVYCGNGYIKQVVTAIAYKSAVFIRTSGNGGMNWGSNGNNTGWARIDNYNSSTEAELASVVAGQLLGALTTTQTELNNLVAGSCYVEKGTNEQNWPTGENAAAWVTTFIRGGAKWQVFFGLFRDYFYVRAYINGGWQSWKKFTGV